MHQSDSVPGLQSAGRVAGLEGVRGGGEGMKEGCRGGVNEGGGHP